ncbi:Aspartyl/asparaginyl beta-hydroxylase (Aspartate beta-hydroxylase) (ASP beta-hydroxylase) (Peptide-aspartate beta-dioxygenase) [Durusdinium trenchii]|uniref:Aspartyl/asparaginyl beta-hydroxylase (Aspartate beta-hydroxylase) (ASP beta-hydroxylase) (Peptide-aspartate beta-dioxygenase) n=1 Tax=Durusdinium trenchii TaxID=1381693 RepID=A0ABP0MM91_9DINO
MGRWKSYPRPKALAPKTEAKPEAKPVEVSKQTGETGKKQSGYVATRSEGRKPKSSLDYSKFDHIEDSDDEKIVPKQSITLPMGLPREAVSRHEYDNVWRTLLQDKQLPYTPAPDLDQMWGYYKYGGMDEQALLDQACEVLGKFPCRLDPKEWKGKTYSLTRKLEAESREDEARMWSILCILRFPDADAYYNQGVLLNKMCDKVKFGGASTAKLPALEPSQAKIIPVEQYCSLFSRAAISYYRRSLKVDPKQRPAYINLIGSLERNEPANWYEDVHELAIAAVKNGIWYTKWQRPPHFVPSLPAKPFHESKDFELSRALEANFPTIRGEYEAYRAKLASRKDWDESDTTPGLGDVGNRPGALHDGGLRKSGKWQEVPLFTNCTIQREYTDLFPETTRILQQSCADATGLAFCGGGDVIFSVLTPGTRLRPHCGPSNARLTCHLAIRVPKSCDQGCYLRVGSEARRGWEEGKCLVFDDSFEHEVVFAECGPSEAYCGDRVVLLANFWHPSFGFKNDPDWRQKSDEMMASVDVETLPQTAMMKSAPT